MTNLQNFGIALIAASTLVLLPVVPNMAYAEEIPSGNGVIFDVNFVTSSSATDSDNATHEREKRQQGTAYFATTLVLFGVASAKFNSPSSSHLLPNVVPAVTKSSEEPVFFGSPDINLPPTTFTVIPGSRVNVKPFTLGLPRHPIVGDPIEIVPVVKRGPSPQIAAVPEPGEWLTGGVFSAALLIGMICGRRKASPVCTANPL